MIKTTKKVYDRIAFICSALEDSIGTNVYHNYMTILKPAGKTLPEPQHNFAFLDQDGTFYGGGMLESRIFDDKVLEDLKDNFQKLIAKEGLKV